MLKSCKGEKHPADVIGAHVTIRNDPQLRRQIESRGFVAVEYGPRGLVVMRRDFADGTLRTSA